MRAFYGAAIAHDLVFPLVDPWLEQVQWLHLKNANTKTVEPNGPMSSDLNRASQFVAISPLNKKFRSNTTINAALAPIASLFNCPNAAKLKTAAIWLLRSETSATPMDKVLESTIALEVLLGDRAMADRIGLTRLMSNRCAYALGKSEGDRATILGTFENFYKLRSEIVHTGRLVVSPQEEELVEWGSELASRMLKFEQRISCQQETT